MNVPEHSLSLSHEHRTGLAKGWLLLGTAALGVAGIFAGMLGGAKVGSSYFYTALVVHVDLSVMMWFLCGACLLMQLAVADKKKSVSEYAGYISTAMGAAAIVCSAFAGGVPFQNNYIPVLYHPLFFLGLALVFSGVILLVADYLLRHHSVSGVIASVRVGILSMVLLLLMAAFCFIWSFRGMPRDLQGQEYYEALFWAGGHVLQIAYTQMVIIAWLWLAEAAELKLYLPRLGVLFAYLLSLLAGGAGVLLVLFFPPESDLHRSLFTSLMRYINGLPALLVGVPLAVALLRGAPAMACKLPKLCLTMSLLLFTVGGGLGYLISGSNLIVPAHYHGSIIGVTLALMGVYYLLLPMLGARDVESSILARLQPMLYGGGQLCWMVGMALLGEQGVGRKIPGSADSMGKVAAFLKHGGDGLSLIGGLLFVFVVLRAVISKKKKA